MTRRLRGVPWAAVVVLVSALAGGLVGGRVFATPEQQQDATTDHFHLFDAALAAIETDYVEPVDPAPLVYGAIGGMLHTLDPHSSFFDPKAYAQMRERQEGSYYGIGIQIVSADGDITVTNVFEQSPADQVGLRRGDVIARIAGEDAKGWTNDQAVAKLKGPKGTTVDIGIRRWGVDGLIPLTVARDEVHIRTVHAAFMVAPGTGYLRLDDFSETSDDEVAAALKQLAGEGMQRLIFDLRDNPGGPLDQAIAVASHFLPRGDMVVYTKGRIPTANQSYHADTGGDFLTTPLVVLVDRGTASASEIVTGAMQDHDRGLVVGEQTFGKALVQSVFSISEGAGLALTTGHYYTPSGRIIQRPWDASFDEYLTYSLRDQTGQRDHPASELHYTDAGRKVYGGGGIEPDHFIVGFMQGFDPSYFSRTLVNEGLFTGFAEHFTAAGDPRPANRLVGKRHVVSRGFEITPAYLDEFKQYLADQHVAVDEHAFAADLPFIKAEMHYEIDYDLFGAAEARQRIAAADPQLQASLGYLDEAAKLLTLGKKH